MREAYRRTAVPQQLAQVLMPKTLPAPIRGLILSENAAFMQPAGALWLDNWFPTENTLRLRGGSKTWGTLTETLPVRSLFSYSSGANFKMFAANQTKLYNVSGTGAGTLVPGVTITNGHFSTAQMATAGGDFLTGVNDAGEAAIQYDGTTWTQLTSGQINGPAGTPVVNGLGLTQVWKYRTRLFFIQANSMNAWYLGINSITGLLKQIPLSGAFTRGGNLLFGCAWSVSAGDGVDDKCIFVTTEGEIAIFTGTDPGDIANWKQQGRYQVAKPLGKNSWLRIGGDVLIATVDGIVPISQALVKDVKALEFSAITYNIHPMWSKNVANRSNWPWQMCKWDEYGGLFVTTPGGSAGDQYCLVANSVTGAWTRFLGWDATCFTTLNGAMYFGTQDGRVVQADVTGKDDLSRTDIGKSYICSYVGGWEVFGSPPNQFVVRQGRCSFNTKAGEPFIPQLTCAVNYSYVLPPPPDAGPDPGPLEVWDVGLWGSDGPYPPPVPLPPFDGVHARWDQPAPLMPPTRSTYWVSIGETGYSHAPIVQVTVNQAAKPDVEMLGVTLLAEQIGVAV